MTERHGGSEVIDRTATCVGAELREGTGGRGPGVCIGAVGIRRPTPARWTRGR